MFSFSVSSVIELQNIANAEILKIEDWMTSNKLTLNHSKPKFMVFQKNSRISASVNIFINGHSIEQVDKIKYLGIMFDAKLNWMEHLKALE